MSRSSSPASSPRRLRTATRSPAGAPASADGAADLCEVRCIDADKVERARAALPQDDAIERGAAMLRVLGDPTRLKIVRALATEELCVCDLATLLGQSQSTVSHSLRALRQMRLVRYRKVGKIAYYAVDDAHVAEVARTVFAHVSEG